VEHGTDQQPQQPTPAPDALTAQFADSIRLECGSDRVNRWNLRRAITRTCHRMHGVTSYTEAARDADAHRLSALTARIPFDGMSGYRYAETITSPRPAVSA
jgi:hypothetical protein